MSGFGDDRVCPDCGRRACQCPEVRSALPSTRMKKSAAELWTDRMRKLLKQCPEGHWLFSADGGLYLMRFGEDGKRRETGSGGMDQDAIVGSIMQGPEIDGGDW